MRGHFADTPNKQVVREQWNTPILRYLNQVLGMRYRYMGLPGTDLLDVKLWSDMIDEVVAFEIRDEPTNEDPYGRRSIRKLRRNLRLLGLPGQVYLGPMEEVIILRTDYEGNKYEQNELVTVYNLDFCNEIASRIETQHEGHQLWRFEALRQILHDQAECFHRKQRPRAFVLLLTVRDQIGCKRLRSFLSKQLFGPAPFWWTKS